MRTKERKICSKGFHRPRNHRSALTFAELMVVIVILGLMLSLAHMNFRQMLTEDNFQTQLQDFVSLMELAATSAAENGKRYEIIVNLDEQFYMFRQITTNDLQNVLEEEIIADRDFSTNCQVVYVLFDDYTEAYDGQVRLRVGPGGWQAGAKIVFYDSQQSDYSVIVNRINRTVKLVPGDPELLLPREDYEVIF